MPVKSFVCGITVKFYVPCSPLVCVFQLYAAVFVSQHAAVALARVLCDSLWQAVIFCHYELVDCKLFQFPDLCIW